MSDYQIVIDSAAIDVTIGEGAEIQAEQAVQYIKSGEKEIDAYVSGTSKPDIADYVETVSKPDLDAHAASAKGDISGYVETVSKPDLDAYVDETSKTEIAAYIETVSKPDIRNFTDDQTAEYDANAAAKLAAYNANAVEKQSAVDASAAAAANSATEAETSAKNAAASMTASAASAQAAANSETEALNSETAAAISEARCEEIFARLGTVIKIKGRVNTPEDLPAEGNLDGDAYLVGVAGLTAYPEYYWFSDHWEFLGTSSDKIEWGTLQGNIANQTDLQTALNGKQAVITGAASTIVSNNLTANMALRTDENGKVVNSSATSTELSYLSGVTSKIQTQLNGKQSVANLSQMIDASPTKYPSNAAVSNAISNIDMSAKANVGLDNLSSDGNTVVDNRVINILKTIYPVGAIYIGTQSTCPLTALISGSTWSLVSSGRALWTGNGSNANTTINAGLPNITGQAFNSWDNASSYAGLLDTNHTNNTSGCFKVGTIGTRRLSYANDKRGYALGFDASRSSDIYGKSATVQPPAYVVNVWRRTA